MAQLTENLRSDRSRDWSSVFPTSQAARSSARAARMVLTAALSAAIVLNLTAPARALVGAVLSGANVPPTDAVGGDPGWSSVSDGGSRNAVYLGDGWVLSARHTGPNPGQTGSFQKEVFSTGTFDVITGSQNGIVPSQNFVVPNPAGSGYSAETDLRLVRIKGDPLLPSIFDSTATFTIASQAPSIGDEVMYIGQGPGRENGLTYWDSAWNEVASSVAGGHSGFKTIVVPNGTPNGTPDLTKRWGKNNIATSNRIDVQLFTPGDGQTRDILSFTTVFDQGGNAYESQAVTNDSGSAVFRKNPSTQQWELAGIVNAVIPLSGQPANTPGHPNQFIAAYGDTTTFADLSYYRGMINDIINAHPDSSVTVMGDLNLDGIVSGDGTGPAATDDVTAFIQGWGTHQSTGNLISWQKGDLNQDGIVDVSDFLLLRTAFNSAGAGAAVSSLTAFVDGAVPEPSSVMLAAIGAAALAMFCRRSRAVSAR